MPRSSSPSYKSSAPMRPPTFHPPVAKPSAVVPFHPTTPTFSQSIKDGVGLGIGSGIGHSLVNRIFGPSYPSHPTSVTQQQQQPCDFERKAFEACLLNNMDVCHNQQLALSECLKLSKKGPE